MIINNSSRSAMVNCDGVSVVIPPNKLWKKRRIINSLKTPSPKVCTTPNDDYQMLNSEDEFKMIPTDTDKQQVIHVSDKRKTLKEYD